MSNLNNNTTQLELLLQKVNELPAAGSGGAELPTLTNEAIAAELLASKQLIDGDGNIITGTMPNNGAISQTMDGINTKSITIPQGYTSGGSVSLDNTIDNEVMGQADLIAQIKSVVDNLPEAGNSVTPSGTIEITANGIYDVVDYASADVKIASSGGGFESNTELCNITIIGSYYPYIGYYGADGYNITYFESTSFTGPISAICGSVVYIIQSGYLSASITGGGEILSQHFGEGFTYRVPSSPTNITINIETD